MCIFARGVFQENLSQLDFKNMEIKLFHVRTFKKCTVAEADPDISIRRGGDPHFSISSTRKISYIELVYVASSQSTQH
jgi:hypothetical protein